MNDIVKSLDGISPYIRRAWDGNMPPDWQLKERVIFDYEFVYIMSGKAIITIEDRSYDAMPGDLFIFRPGVRHSMKTAGKASFRQPHIHFDLYRLEDSENVEVCYRPLARIRPEEMKYFREDVNKQGVRIFPDMAAVKNRDMIEKLFFQVIREKETERYDPCARLRLKAAFISLLACLISEIHGSFTEHEGTKQPNHEKINTVKEYILLKFNTRISLDGLSKISNMSKSHLLRVFKKNFNTSPLQFQINLRINKAREMIECLHDNYSETAQYLGFLNVQHFSRVFKKHTGMCPSDYYRKISTNDKYGY